MLTGTEICHNFISISTDIMYMYLCSRLCNGYIPKTVLYEQISKNVIGSENCVIFFPTEAFETYSIYWYSVYCHWISLSINLRLILKHISTVTTGNGLKKLTNIRLSQVKFRLMEERNDISQQCFDSWYVLWCDCLKGKAEKHNHISL